VSVTNKKVFITLTSDIIGPH